MVMDSKCLTYKDKQSGIIDPTQTTRSIGVLLSRVTLGLSVATSDNHHLSDVIMSTEYE